MDDPSDRDAGRRRKEPTYSVFALLRKKRLTLARKLSFEGACRFAAEARRTRVHDKDGIIVVCDATKEIVTEPPPTSGVRPAEEAPTMSAYAPEVARDVLGLVRLLCAAQQDPLGERGESLQEIGRLIESAMNDAAQAPLGSAEHRQAVADIESAVRRLMESGGLAEIGDLARIALGKMSAAPGDPCARDVCLPKSGPWPSAATAEVERRMDRGGDRPA